MYILQFSDGYLCSRNRRTDDLQEARVFLRRCDVGNCIAVSHAKHRNIPYEVIPVRIIKLAQE